MINFTFIPLNLGQLDAVWRRSFAEKTQQRTILAASFSSFLISDNYLKGDLLHAEQWQHNMYPSVHCMLSYKIPLPDRLFFLKYALSSLQVSLHFKNVMNIGIYRYIYHPFYPFFPCCKQGSARSPSPTVYLPDKWMVWYQCFMLLY